MTVAGSFRIPLLRTFDGLRRRLGNPVVYVFPWQVPDGASYDADVDAWVDDDGDIVTKTDNELTYYEVPALWGRDAFNFVMALGGIVQQGSLVAIAKAEHRAKFDGAMFVTPGTLGDSRYVVSNLENAPDGTTGQAGSGVFVVARLQAK